MLWWGYQPEEETFGKAKGREKAHEAGGQCNHPARGIYGCTGD